MRRARPAAFSSLLTPHSSLPWGLLLAALGGCGKNAEPLPAAVDVKGKVIYRTSKQPVPWVAVVFHPQDAVGTASYPGGTEKNGSFSLRCPPGKYRVTLTPLPLKGQAAGPGEVAAPGKIGTLPQFYRTAATTTLRAEAPAGGTDSLVLSLP